MAITETIAVAKSMAVAEGRNNWSAVEGGGVGGGQGSSHRVAAVAEVSSEGAGGQGQDENATELHIK